MFRPTTALCVAVLLVTGGYYVNPVTAYQEYNDMDNQPVYRGNQPDYNAVDNTDYNDGLDTILLHCFQCNSHKQPDCINIQANDTDNLYYKPCLDTELYKGQQPFCRKIVQKIYERDNMEVVIRKCGWIRHPKLDCYKVRNDDHEEVICQCFTKGCNGSSGILPSLMALVLALLACFTLGKK